MQRRRLLSLLSGLMLGALASELALAQDKPVTIRIASAFEPSTDMMQAAKRFADLVKERSKGSIDVKLFPGGQMGGE